MGIDIEEVVIQPFREVVERGKEAAANAEANQNGIDAAFKQSMLKSARSLTKEGQRALQRLMPLWNIQVERNGDVFMEAIRQNDEILQSQRYLEDLLYDLDDFVEVDTFDIDKFSQVQSASKAFALTLLENIKRIRFDQSPLLSRGMTPTPSETSGSTYAQPRPLRPSTSNGHSQHSSRSDVYQERPVLQRRPSSPDILGGERDCVRLVSSSHGRPERHLESSLSISPPARRSPSRIDAWVNEQTTAKGIWQQPHPPVPEKSAKRHAAIITNNLDSVTLRGPDAPLTGLTNLTYSPATAGSRTSWYTSTASHTSGSRSSVHAPIPTSDQRTTSLTRPTPTAPAVISPDEPRRFMPLPPIPSRISDDESKPTDELKARKKSVPCGYQIGLDSSLYIQKGFCRGAEKMRSKGYKGATKPIVEYGSHRGMARCTDCEFANKLTEIDIDTRQDSYGNFAKHGVLYRMRFLYKCHLISTSAFTMQFGCLFCAHKGHTVHQDDATVFPTQDQLFRHLSRHPQPLPEIPGVTILYGEIADDDPLKENYDLNFPRPPLPSDLPKATQLNKMPTAKALKAHVKRYGRELEDPDGSSENVLKFIEGSRIVGIEFPEKWKGRWCTGWHDGVLGSFPAKKVVFELPTVLPGSSSETSVGSTGMTVVVKWKCEVKDTSTGWLPLDKDETITNVSFLHHDDWCWSGKKKSGKSGFFPRAYVKTETLRTTDSETHEADVDSLDKKTITTTKKAFLGFPPIRARRLTIGSSAS